MSPARRSQLSPRPASPLQTSPEQDGPVPSDLKPEAAFDLPLPRVPSPNEIHEHWDPKYQAVAKCDFCHARVSNEKTAGVLQLCRDCKMSICQDCCLQMHDATKGRLDVYERQGTAEQLTDVQRRWCQFGIQGRHSLDPESVNWEVPEKTKKSVPKKTRASEPRGTMRARRGGRRQGVGRGGRQPAAAQRRSRRMSEFVDDDVESLEGTDDWESKEELDDEEYSLPSARASRGTKHAREPSPTASPGYRAAEEAAGVLARWSSSPRPSTRVNGKRVKTAHEQERPGPPVSPVARPSVLVRPPTPTHPSHGLHEQHHDRPSLPPLTSMLRTWRVEDSPRDPEPYRPQSGYLTDEKREVHQAPPKIEYHDPASHTSGSYMAHERRYDHDYQPSGYSRHRPYDDVNYDMGYSRDREQPAQRYYEDHRRDTAAPYGPAYHAPPGHERHGRPLPPNGPGAYGSPGVYGSRDAAGYAVGYAPRSARAPYYANTVRPYRSTLDVSSLANELEHRTRAARTANPAGRLDDYLAHELSAAWLNIRPPAGGSDEGTATVQAFRTCLSAAYIAMFGLGIEGDMINAARGWLRDTEEALDQGGVPVRTRLDDDGLR